MLIKSCCLHLFMAYRSVNWQLDQTLNVWAYKMFSLFSTQQSSPTLDWSWNWRQNMLSFTLLYIKHVKKFESCLWLVHLLNAVIGLFLIIIFLFVRFRRYTVCLSVIKYTRWFKEHRIAEGEELGRISDIILFYFCFM